MFISFEISLTGLYNSFNCGGDLVAMSCLTLATPWTVACQAPLSIGSTRHFHTLLNSIFFYFVEDVCIYIHERYWSMVFFQCIWFWCDSNAGIKGWVREYSFYSCSLKEMIEYWYNLFIKYLVEFICECIWTWCCVHLELSNYWFNFFNRRRSIQMIYFCGWVLVGYVFQEIGQFHLSHWISC